MERARRHLALPVGLLLAAAALLLLLALNTPPTWTLDLGTAGDSRFLAGFYSAEQNDEATFRWSTEGARLLLHGTEGRALILELRLSSPIPARAHTTEVRLERAGETAATLEVTPPWRVYRVLVEENSAGMEATPLLLTSALQLAGPHDSRQLGVVVDRVRALPVATPRLTWAGASLRRALLLTWGLAVLAWALWQLDRALWPRGRIGWTQARVCVLAGLAAAGLVAWAWRDPYTLAWALPATPWILGMATLLLVARRSGEGRDRPPNRLRAGLNRLLEQYGRWAGLTLLVLAQVLLTTQQAVGLGVALALGGLALLPFADLPHAPAQAAGPPLSRNHTAALLFGIFLVALGLRFYQLQDLPFGLWRDEARHALIGLRMRDDPSYRPIYVAEPGLNMPALGIYPFALALKLWGIHPWSLRPITALAGALTVLPLYGLARRLTGRLGVALLAAAFLAVSSWHVTISRFSFPTIFDPLLGLTGLWLLVVGLGNTRIYNASNREPRTENREPGTEDRGWRIDDSHPVYAKRYLLSSGWRLASLFLAGICVGAAVQTYHSGRVVPLVAAALLGLLLAHEWQAGTFLLRRWALHCAAIGLGGALVLAPLAAYAIQQPEAFNARVQDVFLLGEKARQGRAPLAVLDESLGRHLLMFNVRGDQNGRHHAPGRPMLDAVTGLGWLAGVAMLLRRRWEWRGLFLLGGLGLGLLPSIVSVDSPHAMRSIGAAVFACLIAALGWAELGRILAHRPDVPIREGREEREEGNKPQDPSPPFPNPFPHQQGRGATPPLSRAWERGQGVRVNRGFTFFGKYRNKLPSARSSWPFANSVYMRWAVPGLSIFGVVLALNAWTYFGAMPGTPEVWLAGYPIHTQIGAYLRDTAATSEPESLSQVFIPRGLQDNSVFQYLAYGLTTEWFDGAQLSQPARSGALFVLSGYTYERDLPALAPYLGAAPTPVGRGPELPDASNPSFLVYRTP